MQDLLLQHNFMRTLFAYPPMSHVGKHMRVKVIYLTHTMGSLRPCDTGAQGNDRLQLDPMRNNIQELSRTP
jgi:hypothetical protein